MCFSYTWNTAAVLACGPNLLCCSIHVQVYALFFILLLSALNRLPIKLPSATQSKSGRRHSKQAKDGVEDGSGASPVMFADVAGVDEAKEELQEIVVRVQSLWAG